MDSVTPFDHHPHEFAQLAPTPRAAAEKEIEAQGDGGDQVPLPKTAEPENLPRLLASYFPNGVIVKNNVADSNCSVSLLVEEEKEQAKEEESPCARPLESFTPSSITIRFEDGAKKKEATPRTGNLPEGLVLKNTFIDCPAVRSYSLDGYMESRAWKSCPATRIPSVDQGPARSRTGSEEGNPMELGELVLPEGGVLVVPSTFLGDVPMMMLSRHTSSDVERRLSVDALLEQLPRTPSTLGAEEEYALEGGSASGRGGSGRARWADSCPMEEEGDTSPKLSGTEAALIAEATMAEPDLLRRCLEDAMKQVEDRRRHHHDQEKPVPRTPSLDSLLLLEQQQQQHMNVVIPNTPSSSTLEAPATYLGMAAQVRPGDDQSTSLVTPSSTPSEGVMVRRGVSSEDEPVSGIQAALIAELGLEEPLLLRRCLDDGMKLVDEPAVAVAAQEMAVQQQQAPAGPPWRHHHHDHVHGHHYYNDLGEAMAEESQEDDEMVSYYGIQAALFASETGGELSLLQRCVEDSMKLAGTPALDAAAMAQKKKKIILPSNNQATTTPPPTTTTTMGPKKRSKLESLVHHLHRFVEKIPRGSPPVELVAGKEPPPRIGRLSGKFRDGEPPSPPVQVAQIGGERKKNHYGGPAGARIPSPGVVLLAQPEPEIQVQENLEQWQLQQQQQQHCNSPQVYAGARVLPRTKEAPASARGPSFSETTQSSTLVMIREESSSAGGETTPSYGGGGEITMMMIPQERGEQHCQEKKSQSPFFFQLSLGQLPEGTVVKNTFIDYCPIPSRSPSLEGRRGWNSCPVSRLPSDAESQVSEIQRAATPVISETKEEENEPADSGLGKGSENCYPVSLTPSEAGDDDDQHEVFVEPGTSTWGPHQLEQSPPVVFAFPLGGTGNAVCGNIEASKVGYGKVEAGAEAGAGPEPAQRHPLWQLKKEQDASSPSPSGWKSEPVMSVGSIPHTLGQSCRPCGFLHKPEGCSNEAECVYCHLCPPGTIKERKKVKKVLIRQVRQQQWEQVGAQQQVQLAANVNPNAAWWPQAEGFDTSSVPWF